MPIMHIVAEVSNMKKLFVIAPCFALIVATNGNAVADNGKTTYKQVCSSCHESGVNNAPILEDKLEWKLRSAKGTDALYASILNNKCELLKDLRHDLSNDKIKAAVNYMVSQAK